MQIVKLTLRSAMKAGFIVMTLAMFSCSKQSKLANHIPKDATAVLAFDVKSIGLKSLDFKEIMNLENLKKALTTPDDSATENFKNSGIDFLEKAYFFGKAAEEGKSYGAAIVGLADANKFEALIKKLNKEVAIATDGNFKSAAFGDKGIVGWNESEAILLFGSENPKETILALANLKKEESLASNSKAFSDLENEKADIACWVSFEDFQKVIPQYGMAMGAPGLASMNLKETFVTATCNFEDGQIVIGSKYMTNDEMTKKFNFIKPNISKDVAQALPGKSVIAMMGFGIDMNKLYAYLEEQKLLEPVDASATQMTGLTVKEIFGMLTGDVAVTLNDIGMKDVKAMDYMTGQMIDKKQPNPDYCAVIGIADKAKATQLLTHFVEAGMLTKNENYYSLQNEVFIIEKDNSLTLVGTESAKQFALDGKGEKLNDELSALLSENASSIYLNFGNIPESFYASGNAMIGTNIKNTSVEDIVITSSAVENNVTTGKWVIRFKDKSQNSLITLAQISKKFSDVFAAPPAPVIVSDTEEPVIVEETSEEPVVSN